jgi:2-iminobutanoate/2-iminopropanoate deaminase
VKVGTTIYVAGMAGIDPVTNEMAGSSIQAQTHQSISNCQAVLEAGGASLADVVSVTVLLANPADWSGLNEAYAIAFPTAPPARMVCRLGPDLPGVLVSIAMIAEIDD